MTSITDNQDSDRSVQIAAFYKFVPLENIGVVQRQVRRVCEDAGLLGTILLATEGINGTIAGDTAGVASLFRHLRQYQGLEELGSKISYCKRNPFYRMKVRIKKEIVTLGVEGINPAQGTGQYIAPEHWNDFISQAGVRLIDTRNDYEVCLGTFAGAENPQTQSFRDFPAWAEAHLGSDKNQQVAMFCTGGIRCEKSTAFLKELGYKNVYHLKGGILNYLEKVSVDKSLWQGDCFVFDNRVTVDHDLAEGRHELCPACRMPLSEQDRQSPKFEPNVSCPSCYDRLTPERRASLEERGRQIALAAARGERHIGSR